MTAYKPNAAVPEWLDRAMMTWGEVTVYREDGNAGFPRQAQTRSERRNPGSKMPNVQCEYLMAENVLDHELTPPAIRHLLRDRYYFAGRGYKRPTWESVQTYFGPLMDEDTARFAAGLWEGALASWVRKQLGEIRKDAGAGYHGLPDEDEEETAPPKPAGQTPPSAAVQIVSEEEKARLVKKAKR